MRLKYCLLLLVVSVFATLGYAQTNPIDFGIEMVFVEGGEFMMGCTPEQGNDCRDDEMPAHRVRVSSFEIGKSEVTQAQWKAVMGNNPSNSRGDHRPVESLCWGGYCSTENSAEEFIRRLNEKTGRSYRLPTEAEWEYAARGGNKSKGYKYSGSNTVGEVAWYSDNSDDSTHDVCTKEPNELGLYDMSGNVWEWVQDWYDEYSSGLLPSSDLGLRGGGWSNSTRNVRVSNRDYSPGYRNNNSGFRLARSR